MAVEIAVRLLADFHEQFLVVNGTHELDSRILVESGLLLELFEEVLVHVGNEGEIFRSPAQHELANHCLVVVLGHKAPHNQVIFLGLESLLVQPAHELLVVIGQAAATNLGAIGDEGRLRPVLGISFADVLLDVLRIAHEQIGMLDHAPFGIFPVLAHGQRPFGAEPLVSVGVHVELAAELVYLLLEFPGKGPDAAGKAIYDGMRDLVLLYVVAALVQRVDVV